MTTPRSVVVIGGGIAGLVAARDCATAGMHVTVVERTDAPGGAVATQTVAGIRVDTGAESYATRGGTVRKLVDGLGLADSVVRPVPAGAWVRLADGRSVPLPKAGLLGIPSSPLADDVRRVIGWRGALRAYLDRIRPVLTIGTERNLGDLVRRRMGAAVLESLVAPVTRGVYSADPSDLDVTRAAPGLNRALTAAGSLSGAVAILRSNAPAGSAVEGLRGGMSTLVTALTADLTDRGATLLLGAGVSAVSRIADPEEAADTDAVAPGDGATTDPSGAVADATGVEEITTRWEVALENGTVLEADYVIVAAPEAEALRLLAPFSAEIAAESPVDAPAIELVTLVLDAPALDAAPRGSGVLVAESSGSTVTAKALTHSTAKWQWLHDEASTGHPHRHVVRLSYGRHGAANPTTGLDDTAVRALAVRDAAALLGVPLDDSAVVGFARTVWNGTLPGAAIGQRERAEALRAAALRIGDLDVTGAWLAGTGLASVVPDALAASRRVRHLVAASYRPSGTTDGGHTRPGGDKASPDNTAS
ncbi:FAD-dependent oxidoreductase [Mycetocola manganoxydans]|uniref:FAD-dependent oxidoreductase n=1 Tax=Mycetocola manganoxydans TaxID=699879 RepID=A0A3L6ZUF3_9MICO|nr:FAD-dependent oxidoreductase [Mycetocola manganoxydans]RLP71438.1 FAD-dependent oxidoreductase [Mycetocola manganoxydans]GHD46507.1 protoporphyrinogen oxidase [Mycetocola manganoxydans]